QYCVDILGYLDSIERCRAKYTDLRILSGVELGEPHWFPEETAAVLAAGPLDNVLGSVHCIRLDGDVVDASQLRDREGLDFAAATRQYLGEVLAMIDGGQPFEALAHLDYPKRYWPEGAPPYVERDYEAEIRAVLRAAARSGLSSTHSPARSSRRSRAAARAGSRWRRRRVCSSHRRIAWCRRALTSAPAEAASCSMPHTSTNWS